MTVSWVVFLDKKMALAWQRKPSGAGFLGSEMTFLLMMKKNKMSILVLLHWNCCSRATFPWKLPSLDQWNRVDTDKPCPTTYLWITASPRFSSLSRTSDGRIFWQRSLSSQSPKEVLLSLQALAFLTEENLRLCISRMHCNACGRKGGHWVETPLQGLG